MLDNKYHFRHCSRTAFLTFTILGLIGALSYLSIVEGMNFNVFGHNLIFILSIGAVSGIIGLIYYKIMKRR